MSAGGRRCDRCHRSTPKKRLTTTPVGDLCPRCFDHLPVRLRRHENEGGAR